MIGLIGLGSTGMMYTPSGKSLFRLPLCIASKIQKIQHYISTKTWK